MKSIVLYLHVHQPYRIRHYTIFDAGEHHNYFEASSGSPENNHEVIKKVAQKSYLPTNQRLLNLIKKYPDFKVSMSITGTILDQLEQWSPETLQSFQELAASGRCEIVGETYHHSLAFFYSLEEFEAQVEMHRAKIKKLFGQEPKVFRNTELAYNNDLAKWADEAGYKGILAEGWDNVLGWRNPNFVYRPVNTDNIRLLMKNYKLSDDIAFRFGNRGWGEWPLTADKFAHWLNSDPNSQIFNLFMDYETFGEHQWSDTGIFDFLDNLPAQWEKTEGNTFSTVSEAIDQYKASDFVDCPDTVTWADTERDLSAWTGNNMQQEALRALYDVENQVKATGDLNLIEDWRRLTTSDHFYYMCTKWFKDGDIHAYFSPYDTPYIAFINFMNAWHDLTFRLATKGVTV